MKTVFKSDEIAHIWAHQSASRGTSPGAMSFNGPAFLSYGTEIARHITFKGKPAVIFNEAGFSVTTSKHQNLVRQALTSAVPVFAFGDGRGDSLRDIGGKELFEYAIKRAAFFASKIPKARNKDQYQAAQSDWLQKASQVNEFFGLRRKVDSETIKRLASAKERAEKAQRIAREKQAVLERAEQLEQYEAWKAGTASAYGFRASLFPVAFRVEQGTDGKELVSTLGARVPLEEARKAFRFALAVREKGWHRNGETFTVGHYQLDAVNGQGIVAGCHRVAWDEVERLSPILK